MKKKRAKIICYKNWHSLGMPPLIMQFKNREIANAISETLEELRQQFEKGSKNAMHIHLP